MGFAARFGLAAARSGLSRVRGAAIGRLAAAAFAAATAACYSVPQRPDGGHGLLQAGAPAPDLEAFDVAGRPTRLSSLRGQPVVVYFYPRDGTPGCTTEACAFRDAWQRLTDAHVAVIGVSSQSRESHVDFQQKYRLPFPLVADETGAAGRAYGVSKAFFGYARVSFLVTPNGTIGDVWPDVDPAVHVDEVLAAAARLTSTASDPARFH